MPNLLLNALKELIAATKESTPENQKRLKDAISEYQSLRYLVSSQSDEDYAEGQKLQWEFEKWLAEQGDTTALENMKKKGYLNFISR